jgi:hypothetical protein
VRPRQKRHDVASSGRRGTRSRRVLSGPGAAAAHRGGCVDEGSGYEAFALGVSVCGVAHGDDAADDADGEEQQRQKEHGGRGADDGGDAREWPASGARAAAGRLRRSLACRRPRSHHGAAGRACGPPEAPGRALQRGWALAVAAALPHAAHNAPGGGRAGTAEQLWRLYRLPAGAVPARSESRGNSADAKRLLKLASNPCAKARGLRGLLTQSNLATVC